MSNLNSIGLLIIQRTASQQLIHKGEGHDKSRKLFYDVKCGRHVIDGNRSRCYVSCKFKSLNFNTNNCLHQTEEEQLFVTLVTLYFNDRIV